MTRLGPCTLVVNKDLKVTEFRGDINRFLSYRRDEAEVDLFSLIGEPLAALVPAALWRDPSGEKDQDLIEWAAIRLTGGMLTATSNEAARTLLTQKYPEPRQRLLQLMTFVAQLPEAQVR